MSERYISNIPQEWIATRGRGAVIGVVETGCDEKHVDLQNSIVSCNEFGETNMTHGNHVIATICGASRKPWVFNGLCTGAEVRVAKAALDKYHVMSNFKDALLWLSSFDLDVLNLSLAYNIESAEIKSILQDIAVRSIIFSAYSAIDRFPHSYDFVISVGYSEDHDCDLLGPKSIVSLIRGSNYGEMSGTSMSTAFASGVGGIARAYNKKITAKEFVNAVRGAKLYQFDYQKSVLNTSNKQIIFKF